MKGTNNRTADFFFEVGFLERIKRSGFDFLGSSDQNIASHSFRTAVIGYTLAAIIKDADKNEVAMMCLFHDLPEARTGDINYFQKHYIEKDDTKAINDLTNNLPIENELRKYLDEFENNHSKEAKIARDADALELIFTLKEELDKGNKQAQNWISNAIRRLSFDESVKIAESALAQKSYDWWQKAFNRK